MRQLLTTSGVPSIVSDQAVLTSVAASTSSVQLLAANTDRAHAQVFNDSTSILYLAWGPTATTVVYTAKLYPNGFYELPRMIQWTGPVSGVWATAAGSARVTEST